MTRAFSRSGDLGPWEAKSAGKGNIRFLDRQLPNFSEPEFLERLKRRDPGAIGELVEAYLPQLLRAGNGMGFCREENEDLAQSVFTILLERAERFEGRSHIRTFLFGIFYNKVSEHLRELKRERLTDPIDGMMESRFDARGSWSQSPAHCEAEVFTVRPGRSLKPASKRFRVPSASRITCGRSKG